MPFFEYTLNLGFAAVTVAQVLTILLISVGCALVSKVMLIIFDRAIKKSKNPSSLKSFIRPVLKFALLLVSALIILDYLNIPMTPFVTVLSVVGVALSLSLQDVLSNIFGGLMLLFSHPFEPGDFVEIGTLSGKCVSVSTLYTELLTVDNKRVFIPNKTMTSANIINYTAQESRMVEVKLGVSYDSSEDAVIEAAHAAIASIPEALCSPAPVAAVNNYLESSVEFLFRFWVPTSAYFTSRAAFLSSLRREFTARGVVIPFNRVDINIISGENNR